MCGLNHAAAATLVDMFADSQGVSSRTGSASAATGSATLEPREPRHGGRPGGHSVWISWTAPATGILTVETAGSNFDTLLSIYTLDQANPDKPAMDRLREVASSNDADPLLTSSTQFGVVAGTTYHIAVDGNDGDSGNAILTWTLAGSDAAPPVILSLPPDRALRAGDTVTMTVDFVAGEDARLAWLLNGEDVLGAESGTLTIANFQAANVGRYQLRITAGAGRLLSAPIELQINSEGEISTLARDQLADALNSPLAGRATVDPSARTKPQVQRLRAVGRSAIGVSRGFNGVQVFNTVTAAREPGEPAHCGTTGGASYWLAYQAPTNGLLVLDTEGSTFDTVLAVYTFDPPMAGYQSLVSVACDDNSGGNGITSRLSFNAQSGRTYLVAVDGVNGTRGIAYLNYTLTGAPPPTPPRLLTPPAAFAVIQGQPATFTVVAEGTAPLLFQWFKDTTPIPNATAATLTLPTTQPSDAGVYSVRITNSAGTLESTPVQLTILRPPTIVTAPTALSVIQGQSATFTVVAEGTAPLLFQWFREATPIPNATATTLILPTTQPSDAGVYSVRITNSAGTLESTPVQLSVLRPPTLLTPPTALAVIQGQSATFTVVAEGTAPLLFQWFRDTTPIPNATASTLTLPTTQPSDAGFYSVRITNSAGTLESTPVQLSVLRPPTILTPPTALAVIQGQPATFTVVAEGTAPLLFQWFKETTPILNATAATLTLPAAQPSDAGVYSVRISNSAGTLESTPVQLSVLRPPTILTPPTALAVIQGQSATFTVVAEGTAPLLFQWFKDTTPIPNATAATLILPTTQPSDAGVYSVRITNSAGTLESTPVQLSVLRPPTILTAPTALAVIQGQPATFTVVAEGTAPLLFQWFKDTTPIPNATASTLTLPTTQPSDAGVYSVRITNSAGTLESTPVQLSVLRPPTLLTAPAALSVVQGQSATFTVVAEGTAPLLFQWFKETTPIPNATATTLTLPTTQPSDAGVYSVRVSNSTGTLESTPVQLSVLRPPTIQAEPVDLTVVEGQAATFTVVADGTAPLQFQWFKEATPISGRTEPILPLAQVRLEDSGLYQVRISNIAGESLSRTARLTVVLPLRLVALPESVAINNGAALELRLAAEGSAPIHYLWLRNGSELPGATNATYTLPGITPADAGFYSVVASNAAGVVTSPTITVSVRVSASIARASEPEALLLSLPSYRGMAFSLESTTDLLLQEWLAETNGVAESQTVTIQRRLPAQSAGFFRFRVYGPATQSTEVHH